LYIVNPPHLTGTPASMSEDVNPAGVTSLAFWEVSGTWFLAETVGNENIYRQTDNFRVADSQNGIFPKFRVLDDVTSWVPGTLLTFVPLNFNKTHIVRLNIIKKFKNHTKSMSMIDL